MDALGELNDQTPRIRISQDSPPKPEILFGLDTKLFERRNDEENYWKTIGQEGGWHGDEVETKTVWLGGTSGKKRKRAEGSHEEGTVDHPHSHGAGEACECDTERTEEEQRAEPTEREALEEQLTKLNFEIYRGKPYSSAVTLTSSSALRAYD